MQKGLYSQDAWIRLRVGRDECGTSADVANLASNVIETTRESCADGAEVVNYRIIGGGHTWPGATAYSGPGTTTQSVDAAR